MSIFKDTIKPYVRAQLRARQQIISSEDPNVRNNQLVGYLSKNSWVKMTSLVNYNSYDKIKIIDGSLIDIENNGRYSNDELSRKYQLFGGTLYHNFLKSYNYTDNKTTYRDTALRYGFGGEGSVYRSDINRFGTIVKDNSDKITKPERVKDFIRPLGSTLMPGISDVQITNKSAYGSLREATVKFFCWDKHQLEELEILFMRPGYSVILEWGWSKYIDYNDSVTGSLATINSKFDVLKKENRIDSNNLTITPYPTLYSIDSFNENLNQDIILTETDKNSKKSKANYDAMLGYVKNFNWTLLDNGGYECTTVLISIGEVISSLKVSSNGTIGEDNIFLDPNAPKKYQYTDYEKVLLSLKAKVQRLKSSRPYLPDDIDFNASGSYSDVDLDQLNPTKVLQGMASKFNDRDKQRAKIQKVQGVADSDIENTLATLYNRHISAGDDDHRAVPFIKKIDSVNSNQGQYKNYLNEYIPLDLWVAIMDAYFTLKTSPGNDVYIYFDIPYNTPCLAARDSVSIDPNVCHVENPEAFPELAYIYYNYTQKGYKGVDPILLNRSGRKVADLYDFYSLKNKFGYLDNIVINIDYLLSTFKNMNSSTNNDGVDVLSYIQNVMNGISNALGGLNNFKVFVNENKITIGDAYYLEDPNNAKINTKFQFDLMGLGSICRDVKITSRIFQEQSTMIAIGAQNKANVGDIYSSTQTLFNAGLYDRLAYNKEMAGDIQQNHTPESIKSGQDELYNKLLLLATYIKDYIIGKEVGTSNSFEAPQPLNPSAASSTLRSILLQFNPEINYKALIPFELEITLDGISGLVIGQIFTINKNILPKDYYNKNLGFIITGIKHDLSKNDWTTTIKTQICLLDGVEGYIDNQTKVLNQALVEARKKKSVELVQKYNIQALNYGILQDYILYLANRSILSYTFADMDNVNAQYWGTRDNALYKDAPYTGNDDDKKGNEIYSLRYESFVKFVNSVNQGTSLEYYNINAGDFVQKPTTPIQLVDGRFIGWYPAKQFDLTSNIYSTGIGRYDDWFGYDTFALAWITSLKKYLTDNPTDAAGENIGDKKITEGSDITFSQMLDKYIEEISYHLAFGETIIKTDPANPKPFECFRPDLYLTDGSVNEGDQSIKEDLATGDGTGRNTILTPNGWNSRRIFTPSVFTKFQTPAKQFDFYNINYDRLYKSIQDYLNEKIINNFSLRILYNLYTSGEIATKFGPSYITTRNNQSSPVYKKDDMIFVILNDNGIYPLGAGGLPVYDVYLQNAESVVNRYQIINRNNTKGDLRRKDLYTAFRQ